MSNRHLDEGCCSEEEKSIAEELKNNLDDANGNEIDLEKSALIFRKMGKIYRQRSPDKLSLIRSAALFNASLVRSSLEEQEETKSDLEELCHHIVKESGAYKVDADLLQLSKDNKKKVDKMRKDVNDILPSIPLVSHGLSPEERKASEKKKCEEMIKIQDKISKDFINIMADLARSCEEIMGEPPCKYAVVGLGSLARKEVTPYSDFEHCIILEDCTPGKEMLEYFRWFTLIFHVTVINFQETIIPNVAICSLNDYSKKEEDWFYDSVTKRGICFDGMIATACKIPLGRQEHTENKKFPTELIKTIEEMLKYLKPAEIERNGYELATILSQSCFVYGEKIVFDAFESKSIKINKTEYDSEMHRMMRTQVKADRRKAGIDRAILQLEKNEKLNMKLLIYRAATLFIPILGRLRNSIAPSNFGVIEKLFSGGVISETARHRLTYAVALACEIRLKWYMKNERQNDFIDFQTNRKTPVEVIIDLIGKESLVSYVVTTFALQNEVLQSPVLEFDDSILVTIKQNRDSRLFEWNRLKLPRSLRELE